MGAAMSKFLRSYNLEVVGADPLLPPWLLVIKGGRGEVYEETLTDGLRDGSPFIANIYIYISFLMNGI
jgi:hypothetical protein